eukprot:7383357-Prymnesium_polylepis.2
MRLRERRGRVRRLDSGRGAAIRRGGGCWPKHVFLESPSEIKEGPALFAFQGTFRSATAVLHDALRIDEATRVGHSVYSSIFQAAGRLLEASPSPTLSSEPLVAAVGDTLVTTAAGPDEVVRVVLVGRTSPTTDIEASSSLSTQHGALMPHGAAGCTGA